MAGNVIWVDHVDDTMCMERMDNDLSPYLYIDDDDDGLTIYSHLVTSIQVPISLFSSRLPTSKPKA